MTTKQPVENDLPEGWVEVELGTVCDFIGGGTPSKQESKYWNGDIPWASIKDIKGNLLIHTQDFITEEGLKNSAANLAMPNDIILGTRINPGKPIISKIKTAINQDLKVVKPKIKVNTNFLFYSFLNIEKQIREVSSGTTVLGVNLNNLNLINISIPPLPEQRAIVARLEELFSELDNGIANLQAAQAKLDIYRQAVLKKAFEGELTKAWREQQRDLPTAEELLEQIKTERQRYYEQQVEEWKKAGKEWEVNGNIGSKPSKPNKFAEFRTQSENSNLMPICWLPSYIEFLLSLNKKGMTTGPFGTLLKKSEHTTTGVPVLGIENIGEGVFKLPNKIFVSEKKAEELSSFEVEFNDIIISRSGTVGEICVVSKQLGKALISTNLIRVSLNPKIIDSKYFVYLFQGGNVREQVKNLCKGSTRDFLNQTILNSILFPLPSLQEQHQIVQEIESRLSVCDKLAEAIDAGIAKAEALRQSILKRAFEGKLLTKSELAACRQAVDWEPAEKLLERIRQASRERVGTVKS